MGVIQREMHKLRHLEMVQDVDGKLEKRDSETVRQQEIENGALTE